MMTIELITNKADFQRHLNGCERRLNDYIKSVQIIDKLFLNNTQPKQETLLKNFNEIKSQEKFLYSSILTLDQSSFASNAKKRLDYLKTNLEKTRIKSEKFHQDIQSKYGDEFQSIDTEESTGQQLIKLMDKEDNELDLIQHRTFIVRRLEQDITELNGAYIDLNRLIHEQGTIVNNIEQSLTTTDEKVAEATEHVKTTVHIKKRSSRIKWILICILLGTLLFLILIIFFTLKLAMPYG